MGIYGQKMMKITIFTATYNRSYCLPTLYASLQQQTFANFEWLIVDDGSTDTTATLVTSFQLEDKLSIRYLKQENGGKHRAINTGLQEATGDLFFIVDSDDRLPADALTVLVAYATPVMADPTIAGVAGRKTYFNQKRVGSQQPFAPITTDALSIRYQEKIQGDLAEVFKTEVLKKFPFPTFPNEKFCPEALVWNRIAQHYKLVYFDEPIYECEYLEGGLTSSIVKIRRQSPQLTTLHYAELERLAVPFLQKLKANINFWRFSFQSTESFWSLFKSVSFINSIIGLPLGLLMYVNDGRKL